MATPNDNLGKAADTADQGGLVDELRSLAGTRKQRRGSGPLAAPADPAPIGPQRGIGERSTTATTQGGGWANPLKLQPYDGAMVTVVSADGFFVHQYPASDTYLDADNQPMVFEYE